MLPSIQRTTTTPTWVVPSRTRLEPLLRTRAGPLLWLVKRTSGRAGQGRVEQRGAERRGEATARAGGGVPEKHAHQVGEADGRRREEPRFGGSELEAECVCAGRVASVAIEFPLSYSQPPRLSASQPLSLSSPLLFSSRFCWRSCFCVGRVAISSPPPLLCAARAGLSKLESWVWWTGSGAQRDPRAPLLPPPRSGRRQIREHVKNEGKGGDRSEDM